MAASDGSGANSAFITGASDPVGVAADANYVYWTNSRTGAIGRASLSGASPNQAFIPNAAAAQTALDGIAVGGGYIFWADTDAGTIGRANLDGSNVQPNFITGANGPTGIATNGQEIYWANDGGDTIGEAGVDGSGVNQAFIGYTAAGQVNGIALSSQYMFWTNDANGAQSIGRANLDGSGAVEDFIIGSGVTTPAGIAADGNYVYWSNYATPGIARADADGTNVNPSFITTASDAFGVTLAGLPPVVPPIVNSTGDAPAANPTSGSCDTGATVPDATGTAQPECTLRAAIQTVDALGKGNITFNIPASALALIKPVSALPTLTAAGALIDGTTEAGGIVTVDGGALPKTGDCLNVAAAGVTVQGVDLANCPQGIELQPPGQDKVQDDLLGFGADRVTAASGGGGVIIDAGSDGSTIGGVMPAQRDVIGNQSDGITIAGSGNMVQGDLIGTDPAGTGFAPDQIGVAITGAGNAIGGVASSPGTAPGNVILAGSATSTFSFGVLVEGGSNTVAGNLIGTDATGTQIYGPPAAGHGAFSDVLVAGPASGDVVGGGPGAGNVIAGATSSQVLLDGVGAVATTVSGNTVGAGVNGAVLATPESDGIVDAGASGAIIGQEGAGNTVTGQHYGVVISNQSQEIDFTLVEIVDGEKTYQYYAIPGTDTPAKFSNATVKGNIIGPLPGGRTVPAGGGETDGILDSGGQGDRIGPGNTISWNGIGLQLDRTDDVQVDGNRIGTNVSGLDALPNGIGVDIIGSAKTGLGFAGEPDTISGNRLDVRDGGKITKIEAELIGPTSLGNTELKPYPGGLPAASDNLFKGVPSGGLWVEDKAEHTLIGGDGTGEGVVIGGIDGTGLLLDSRTLMVEDHIGVGRDGTSALAITGDGIVFKDARVSGITDSIVAHDGKAGIVVDGRDGVAIVDTPIFDNHHGGIRIPEPSATVPPPKLISAVNNGSGTDISTDVTIPHGEFGRIQFWATATCEDGGAGRKLLDTSHDIHAGRHHDLKASSADTEAVGTAITATLTVGRRAATGAPIGRTSTFSACVPVEPAKKK